MTKNPFQPSEAIGKYFKGLFWGESSSGKTVACLSFKKLGRMAYIDTERGTDLYLSELGEGVDIFRTADLNQIEEALKFIKEDNGKTYAVVVLDSISPVYQTLLEAEMKRIESKPADKQHENAYTKTNVRIRYLYNDLVALPCHVIVTARQAEKYVSQGNFFKSVGSKADSSKDVNYPFDFVIEMEAGTYEGKVIKQRLLRNKLKSTLEKVSVEAFEGAIEQISKGKQLEIEDERAVVARLAKESEEQNKPVEVGVLNFTNQTAAKRWYAKKMAQGLTEDVIMNTLGVTRLSELGKMTFDEADAKLLAGKEVANGTTPVKA